MTLTAQVPDEGDSIYYSESWRTMIECHLPILLARQDNTYRTIAPYNALRFEGDFMGVMTEYRFAPQYHWVIMRMNGLNSPEDYRVTMEQLLIPNFSVIEMLTNIHRTTMQKIK